MEETIIEQLKSRVGLSEEQAKQAAKVVMELVEKHGGDLLGKAKGVAGGLGGLMGKD